MTYSASPPTQFLSFHIVGDEPYPNSNRRPCFCTVYKHNLFFLLPPNDQLMALPLLLGNGSHYISTTTPPRRLLDIPNNNPTRILLDRSPDATFGATARCVTETTYSDWSAADAERIDPMGESANCWGREGGGEEGRVGFRTVV